MGKKNKKKYTSIGGQALMEGIMMRGPHKSAMAVRRANGEIYLETWDNKKPTIWNKIPLLRGIISFISSLTSGSKTLMRSAEIAIEDEENAEREREAAAKAAAEAAEKGEEAAEEAAEAAEEAAEEVTEAVEEAISEEPVGAEAAAEEIEATVEELSEEVEETAAGEITEAAEETVEEAAEAIEEAAGQAEPEKAPAYPNPSNGPVVIKGAGAEKADKKDKDKKKDSDMGGLTFFSVVLGIGLAMLLFVFLPTWCYTGILKIPGAKEIFEPNGEATVWKSVLEGVIKMIVFLTYIIACTALEDIRRVFEYHGAEHKTIFCYEAKQELTVENVKKFKRFHPRCGTSFIVLMVLVGIVAGACITYFLPQFDNVWMRPLIKLAILPLVMGVGYELLKMCGKHDNIFTKIICAPGLWVQRITTREPDDGMIECAIAALKEVIPEDGADMK